jgi:hypothetical protein
MGRKKAKTDWLSEDYSAKEEKLPTIRQYLRELPNNVEDIKSTVRVIWLPGQWNNYTLQCDHFRVIVSERHKLYHSLRDNVDEFTKGTQTLDVIVTDRESVSYRLGVNNETTGEWFFIGAGSGLKFTTSDVPGTDSGHAPF